MSPHHTQLLLCPLTTYSCYPVSESTHQCEVMTSADAFRRAAMKHMSSLMVVTGSWGERDQGAIMSIARREEEASKDGGFNQMQFLGLSSPRLL